MELDQQKLSQWFTEKWKHGPCPVCSTDLWTPLPRLGMVPNLNPLGPGVTNVVPILLIGCTNCGYTLPINALAAELLKDEDWSDELSRYSPLQEEQTVKAGG